MGGIRIDAVRQDVIALVHKELESANSKFLLFHSAHEGYAVLLEEIEEAEEAIHDLSHNTKIVQRELWSCVRNNIEPDISVQKIYEFGLNLAIEAIQVAAMAQKFIDSKKDPLAEKLGEILEGERKRIGGI